MFLFLDTFGPFLDLYIPTSSSKEHEKPRGGRLLFCGVRCSLGWSIIRLKTTRSTRLRLPTTVQQLAAQRVELRSLVRRPTSAAHPNVPTWQAQHIRVSRVWPSMQFAALWTRIANLTPSSCHAHPAPDQMTTLEWLLDDSHLDLSWLRSIWSSRLLPLVFSSLWWDGFQAQVSVVTRFTCRRWQKTSPAKLVLGPLQAIAFLHFPSMTPWYSHDQIKSDKWIQILYMTGWWFGTFFIVSSVENNHPNWLIFFRGVQTTNQMIKVRGF